MAKHGYTTPISRRIEIAVGSLSGLIALVLTAIGLMSMFALWQTEGPKDRFSLWFGLASLAIGAALSLLAFRLLSGRARRADGGLLSPLVLRVWGVLFLAMPALFLLQRSWAIIDTAGCLAASTACFALARSRTRSATGPRGYEPTQPL